MGLPICSHVWGWEQCGGIKCRCGVQRGCRIQWCRGLSSSHFCADAQSQAHWYEFRYWKLTSDTIPCLPVCLPACLSVCVSVCLSVWLFIAHPLPSIIHTQILIIYNIHTYTVDTHTVCQGNIDRNVRQTIWLNSQWIQAEVGWSNTNEPQATNGHSNGPMQQVQSLAARVTSFKLP